MTDLAAQLRALADRVDGLAAADIAGELERLPGAVDELADLDGPTVRYVEARPPDADERIAAALALLLRTGALDA